MLVSVTERDAAVVPDASRRGAAVLEPFECALREAGLEAAKCHAATAMEVADSGSSWAKRLGIPERRPAWVLVASKACGVKLSHHRS